MISLEKIAASKGPLYLRLKSAISDAVFEGTFGPGEVLPSERDLATLTGMSRVTVRKAVQELVECGQLVQRRGSGTFVAHRVEKVEQALSMLTSFSEDMARRGKKARSIWLSRTLDAPSPRETMALGLSAVDQVVRLERVREADGIPLAIECATLAASIMPDPSLVQQSLYEALSDLGMRPVRAVQKISADTVSQAEADLLGVTAGMAGLRIERVSYLPSGRAVEFTQTLYRGDAYDFAVELRMPERQEKV